MRLKALHIILTWPKKVSFFELRHFIVSKLKIHGEPLRWAITAIDNSDQNEETQLTIEAVVMLVSSQRTEK